ncbi:hypothetical protein WJ523_22925, partial [Ralstonia solanacearum]
PCLSLLLSLLEFIGSARDSFRRGKVMWPANRSGPNSKTGIYGTCKLMNLNQSNAVPSVISDLFAPTAYKSQPGYANVGGCCQKITGQASSIQFAFALAGGNVPQNTDTFSGGTIQVYGWN